MSRFRWRIFSNDAGYAGRFTHRILIAFNDVELGSWINFHTGTKHALRLMDVSYALIYHWGRKLETAAGVKRKSHRHLAKSLFRQGLTSRR